MSAVVEQFHGGLVVSCQAPRGHPLRVPGVIALLAQCADLGGAVGLRINSPEDILAVREISRLPIIGLHKVRGASGRDVITPGFGYAAELVRAGADVVAIEATDDAPDDPWQLIARVAGELKVPVMADVDTLDHGLAAWQAGAALVSTTLSGYTIATKTDATKTDARTPDLTLVATLASRGIRTVAEGRYASSQSVADAFAAGAWTVVVGTAITNPLEITRQFVSATPRANR